jgi:hypothetical protein
MNCEMMPRTLFRFVTTPLIPLLAALLVHCATGPTFSSLRSPDPARANLYLLRPDSSLYPLATYDLEIARYESHFSNSGAAERWTVSLKNNEYIVFATAPGFHKISIIGDEYADKIINVPVGQNTFVMLDGYATNFFTPLKLMLKEISAEDAAALLLRWDRMTAAPGSLDYQ